MAATDARVLASTLAALADEPLRRILAERRVPPATAWADYYDMAEALLDTVLLGRGIAALSRTDADALQRALDDGTPVPPSPHRDDLTARGFLDDDGMPFRGLRDVWPGLEPAASLDTAAAGGDSAEHAAERAFAASTSLADILQLSLAAPLNRIGSGALGAGDRRRLVESGAASDGEEADELIAIAEHAGLIAPSDRQWLVTATGVEWLATGTVPRWASIARALRDTLPSALRDGDGGWIPLPQWPGAYPFDTTWPLRAARSRRMLERWAMVDGSGATPPWAAGLARGGDADHAALQALLPPEVDRVYLQNDLTAISPGPLAPHLDMRLRTMARRESRAQASTYRFTAESLSSALTAGETAETLRSFLEELSLTGLPQPLAYEIERSAARHGTIRVGPDAAGRTRVTSHDRALLRAVAVDQALRPLGLYLDGEVLISRSLPETAFWMLADARYPVVSVDIDGNPRALDRHRLAAEPDGMPADPYAGLLARLRGANSDDSDAAWLGRELEQAVRSHAIVTIVVRLPDGSDREITMEATGLGGGRLRGRDRAADVERTLPVSSIVSVRPGA